MAFRDNNSLPPAYVEALGTQYQNPVYNAHMNPERNPLQARFTTDGMSPLERAFNEVDNDYLDEDNELSRLEKGHLNLHYKKVYGEHGFMPNKLKYVLSMFHLIFGIVSTTISFIVYFILFFLLGVVFAVLWGIVMGSLMFTRSWIISPLVKIVIYSVAMVAPMVTEPLRAVLMPLADVAAYPFRHIKIKHDLNGGLLLPLAAQNQQRAQGNEAP